MQLYCSKKCPHEEGKKRSNTAVFRVILYLALPSRQCSGWLAYRILVAGAVPEIRITTLSRNLVSVCRHE